ncbi:MAG TPA: shikimate dehydrogenase [Gammaproteobacteria bacterium]|nr:shikimate dehydrogenase [Gammaproteobacteria bacterium]
MGNPIRHSLSPRIHTLFAAQTGQRLSYTAIQVDPGGFSQAVSGFIANGGQGLNVTVPFKEEAWALVDSRSERADRARAVNTLIVQRGGRLHGDNTDGVGLMRDLRRNHGAVLADRRVLLLGAGGAARGVLAPLLAEQPRCLFIANRTVARAEELAADFADRGPVAGGGFDELAGRRFDLLINATAASLNGELPPLPDELLAAGAWCYEMMYGARPTPFMGWAQAHGAVRVLDGLGMLVEQAAESFCLWRQVRPDTAPVLRTLRQELGGGAS